MVIKKKAIQELIDNNAILIFSKTWCPYCAKAKSLLTSLAHGKQQKIIEIDLLTDEETYQDILLEMTGQRTVPSIFINHKFIGGNDVVQRLHSQGKLVPLINEAA